ADPHSVRLAVHRADLIRVAAPDLATAAATRTELRAAIAAAGRDPNQVRVLLDLDIHLAATVDAAAAEVAQLEDWIATPAPPTVFHIGTAAELRDILHRVETDCAADGVVLRPLALPAVLPHLPALTPTLRGRLGLARPASRYATA
ncbi:LLM class flavin-dependent oxidoreductase, partial [Nocardia sp. NPDC004722]